MTISPAVVALERSKAKTLYQDYKKHLHYAKPIDKEIGRAYQLLAQGRLIIRVFDSIKNAGVNENGLPILALARADWKECFCNISFDGSVRFAKERWLRSNGQRYMLPAE